MKSVHLLAAAEPCHDASWFIPTSSISLIPCLCVSVSTSAAVMYVGSLIGTVSVHLLVMARPIMFRSCFIKAAGMYADSMVVNGVQQFEMQQVVLPVQVSSAAG